MPFSNITYIAYIKILVYNKYMMDIIFYSELGQFPVVNFIDSLNSGEKAEIIRYFDLLEEFGLDLGTPYIKKVNSKYDLWQMRIPYGENDLYFFFFPLNMSEFIFTHGIKKTPQVDFVYEFKTALKVG